MANTHPIGIKRNFSVAQKEEMSRLYREGKSLKDVSEVFGTSIGTVWSNLRRMGVQTRDCFSRLRHDSKTTLQQRNEIVRRYLEGESPTELSRDFGVHTGTIHDYIISRGHETIREAGRPVIYSHNADAFLEPSEDRDYWVGMLITDGCVVERERDISVCLLLKRSDEEHIREFCKFVGTSQPISQLTVKASKSIKRDREASRIAIYSRPLAESLYQFGVVPRKTHTARASAGMAESKHFWRGVIDGDGCITRNGPILNRCVVKLGCMGELPYQFRDFVHRYIGPGKSQVRRSKRGILIYEVSGERAALLLDMLYGKCKIALPRKRERALQVIRSGGYLHLD